MRSCWRLIALALALAAVSSFTVYPTDGGISGIFDDRATFADLDDDFDQTLRRLRPPTATESSAPVLVASGSPILRLALVVSGAGLVTWTSPPPADRGPPGGLTRLQAGPSPSLASFSTRSHPLAAPTRQLHIATAFVAKGT